MKTLLCVVSVLLAASLTAAEPEIVGSWQLLQDTSRHPKMVPESICLVLRPDGSFRLTIEGGPEYEFDEPPTEGRYERVEGRIVFTHVGGAVLSEPFEIRGGRLRLGETDERTDSIPMELERVAWCEGPGR